jgi:hypothetical protein
MDMPLEVLKLTQRELHVCDNIQLLHVYNIQNIVHVFCVFYVLSHYFRCHLERSTCTCNTYRYIPFGIYNVLDLDIAHELN